MIAAGALFSPVFARALRAKPWKFWQSRVPLHDSAFTYRCNCFGRRQTQQYCARLTPCGCQPLCRFHAGGWLRQPTPQN
jgi:hypothetical protein